MSSQVIHTEGRRFIFQAFFKNGGVVPPVTLYLGLRKLDGASGRPADAAAADTLTSNLAEVETSSGYARIALTNGAANFPESLSGADSLVATPQQTWNFNAGPIAGNVTHAFLATSADNTGKLLFSAPLSIPRPFNTGDTLKDIFEAILTQG